MEASGAIAMVQNPVSIYTRGTHVVPVTTLRVRFHAYNLLYLVRAGKEAQMGKERSFKSKLIMNKEALIQIEAQANRAHFGMGAHT